MPDITPSLDQLNIIVRDMDATVAFNRRLGLPIEAAPATPDLTRHRKAAAVDQWRTRQCSFSHGTSQIAWSTGLT